MSGETWFRGFPCCTCLARWLPVYEAELQRRGTLKGSLPIYQLNGNAKASAGTHKGGAFDISDLVSNTDVEVARQMGADATWARKPPAFIAHLHGVLRGCPHNEAARYQIAAVDAGYNGLGYLGHGGSDDGPRPLSYRTWKEGIEWAKLQGDDMFTDKDSRTLDEVRKLVKGLNTKLNKIEKRERKRDERLRHLLVTRHRLTKEQLDAIFDEVEKTSTDQ